MHFVIARGKTRIVIAFPSLHFVIKFPIIHFSVLKDTYHDIRKGDWNIAWHHWKMRVENPYGRPFKLVGGVWANLLEFFFWQKTRHPFLYPTWFSFFGLFNIQKYGKPLGKDEEWVGYVVERLSNGASIFCGHGFETFVNYSSANGLLRMIDYGNRSLWPVIIEHGNKFANATIEECKSEKAARKN